MAKAGPPIDADGMTRRFGDLSATLEASTVAVLEIQRPPNNFMDLELLQQIMQALDWALEQSVRAIVLCSAGKHFCAGLNLATGRRGDGLETWTYAPAVRLFASPVPIIAAVQGAAVGGGMGLALAADFRVASAGTRFSANFARLGFHHGFGLTVSLPRVVGNQRAAEMLYTGNRVPGDIAYRMGLCDRLVDDDQVRAAAIEFAREIAGSAPLAVRAIRATIRGDLAEQVRHAADHELAEQKVLVQTEDFAEAIRAARDRRPPHFHGR